MSDATTYTASDATTYIPTAMGVEPDWELVVPWLPTDKLKPHVFVGELALPVLMKSDMIDRTLRGCCVKDIVKAQGSPTVGVTLTELREECNTINKWLGIKAPKLKSKVPRPRVSSVEIALVFALADTNTKVVIARILGLPLSNVKQILRDGKHLYKSNGKEIPKFPLVMITDTSRFWTEEDIRDAYDISGMTKVDKDLLRSIKERAQHLGVLPNTKAGDSGAFLWDIQRASSLPDEIPWAIKEGLSGLYALVRLCISREGGVHKVHERETFYRCDHVDDGKLYYEVDAYYVTRARSDIPTVKVRSIKHNYTSTNKRRMKVPKSIVTLMVDILNNAIRKGLDVLKMDDYDGDSYDEELYYKMALMLRGLVIAPEEYASHYGYSIQPLASTRALGASYGKGKDVKYTVDSPPLLLEPWQVHKPTYSYGIVCNECSMLLGDLGNRNGLPSSCEHMHLRIFIAGAGARRDIKVPNLYVYREDMSSTFSLHYIDEVAGEIYTKDLIGMYSSWHIPIAVLPYEATGSVAE